MRLKVAVLSQSLLAVLTLNLFLVISLAIIELVEPELDLASQSDFVAQPADNVSLTLTDL